MRVSARSIESLSFAGLAMPFSRHMLSLTVRAVALVALAIAPVRAQTALTDPLSPAPSAMPLAYQSAFEGYRPFRNDEIANWRSVNDTVRSVGGHTGSVRDIAKPTPPIASAPMAINAPEQPAPEARPRMPVDIAPMPGHGH